MFQREDVPYSGFYRLNEYPAFKAVADLIQACHSSLVSMLPIKPGMLTLPMVEAIHQQRCSEKPSWWSVTPPSMRRDAGRQQRAVKVTSAQQPQRAKKQISGTRMDKRKVKEACRASALPTCQAFNLAISCPRSMNAAGNACLFVKAGVTTELLHNCPFQTTGGARCGAAHSMVTQH